MELSPRLYLSRLILNPRNRQAQWDLANCHDMHRTVLSAFPQSESDASGARSEFGILYRVEINPQKGKVQLIVQSHTRPDWSKLPKNYLLDLQGEEENPACRSIDDIYNNEHKYLPAGKRLMFRLRANPTRRVSSHSSTDEAKWHGKRVELCREEDQIAWLRRKAESAGFQLLSVRVNPDVLNLRVHPETKSVGWRKDDSDQAQERRLTFGSVLFEGELLITDADRFRQALTQGIGSGKAYGFGLLSIARVRN